MAKDFAPSSQGERIRKARTQKEWTQAELANKVGVATTTVQNWESGRKPAGRKNLHLVAKVLNVKFSWLDGEEKTVSSLSWSSFIGRQVTLLLPEPTGRLMVTGRLAGVEAAGIWLADVVALFGISEVAGNSEDLQFHAFGTFIGNLLQEAHSDG